MPLEALADLPDPDDPATTAVDAISTRAAVALIATLRDQAEVVLLRVVAGLEVAEVAAITGKHPGLGPSPVALRRLAASSSVPPRVRGGVTPMGSDGVFLDGHAADPADRLPSGRLDAPRRSAPSGSSPSRRGTE